MAWKWDRTIYDRDRWMASTGRSFTRLEDGSLAITVHASNEQSYGNDIYKMESETFALRSADLGVTWERWKEPLPPDRAACLSGGKTVIQIISGGATSVDEKRETLRQAGANPETAGRGGYDLWPASKQAEFEAQDFSVNQSFPGIIGTLFTLTVGISTDGGRTFTDRTIEELPRLARTSGFSGVKELSDGAIIAACMGRRGRGDMEFAYLLRSEDRGVSWSFHPIAEDPSNANEWPETDVIELPNGRILAMHRHHKAGSPVGDYLWQNFSDDGGKTWSQPEETPIWGYPPYLLVLGSGKLLVTYAHRRHPYGVRACMSSNNGESWDLDNEKIIRDDSLPGLVWYPTTTQLEDGTLLSAYSMSKMPRILYREDDQVGPTEDLVIHSRKRVGEDRHWLGGYHGFAAVSRYTEDYVRAPGQETSRTMFDEGFQARTGHDEE